MLCFSVDQENSDEDCVLKWIFELRTDFAHVPIVLVLMKNDLLESEEYKEDREKIKFDEPKLK